MDSPLSRPRAPHGALSTTLAALLFLAAGCLAVAPGTTRSLWSAIASEVTLSFTTA